MYTYTDFPTKKALLEAIKLGPVHVYQPGPFGGDDINGLHTIEGPHYPKPHRWYVRVRVKDNVIVEVLR